MGMHADDAYEEGLKSEVASWAYDESLGTRLTGKARQEVADWVDQVRFVKLGKRPNPNWDPKAARGKRKTVRRKRGPVRTEPAHQCPNCHGHMVMRTNRTTQEQFWGCARWPECNGTRNADGSITNWEARRRQGKLKNHKPRKRKRVRNIGDLDDWDGLEHSEMGFPNYEVPNGW